MVHERKRIAVYGGRAYQDRAAVFSALDAVFARYPDLVIVHGACTRRGSDELAGADRWADEWAQSRGVPVERYPADWQRHHFGAGPRRNQQMVDSGLDGAVEFPGGSGTTDMRRRLERAGVPVWRPVWRQ